ncbi:MAG: cellulose binding domain-containing protein [Lachnospiraceae bacterium]|nr:cellulose binding domain-containing protein [Lachnospiraceae bacterium]
MKTVRKRQIKRWGRQLLSFVLVVALMLGLIPSSAYATGVTPTKAEQTYASQGCNITYKETSSWGNYVNADIVLKNDTDSDKSLWKIEMVYDGCIDNIWNADIISSEDGHYIIAAKTYNNTITAGKSVNFGFIAYGEDGKPEVPSNISFVEDSVNKEEASTEEDNKDDSVQEEDGNTQEQEYEIPEKWKGLNYALFTSGKEKLSLHTSTTNINGSVHTNQDFYYRGTSLKIDGVLEATKGITLKTSSGKENLFVASKKEKADVLEMPDITKEVYSYVKENGTIYEGNKDFNRDSVVIDTPIGIEGNAIFNASTFLGQGIVYAQNCVTYNVGDLSTPEDSRVFIASENGNITLNGSNIALNAVLYAPNGCVYINASNVNINGRIIAKQICINGSRININAGPYDYDMLTFLFKPQIALTIGGNQKVNRKVTLSVEEILNTEYIVKEDTVWNITKDGTVADEQYSIDYDNSNAFHKEVLFKEAGTYTATVTVTTGKVDYTVTKEVVVVEDMFPIAGFTLDSDYYTRNEGGTATIELKDCSTSPDGDVIGQRIWTIYYDENNDGVYDESEGSILSDGNETKVTFEIEKVGKYKVVLRVVETFEDTIPKFLPEDAYLQDDTTEYTEKECVFEVGNEAPLANLDIEKSKSVDIVFTVGDTDKDSLEVYNAKAESLKKILAEKEIDAKVDTVSTSTFTAQDTFAWKEYSHYNCDGFAEHIMYEDNSIKMVGYYSSPKKDFLYIANDNPGQKTFEFDLQRDRSDWHSMEGGGFLFNTTVDEENNTIRGFCILVSQAGLKLVQIDCNNLKAFRDGSYNWVQHAGKLLKTFPIQNLYDSHHFKIVVDNKTISVWDGDTLVIDNYILPDNDYGYGFGPITSHASHGCSQRSYFTFQNIRMESMTGSSLSDIVDGYEWRPGASHYVFHFSNTEVPELASEEETADLAAALIKTDAAFIGIGNEANEGQYLSLLNAIETGGMYLPMNDIGGQMDEANAYIVDSVLAKNYTIEQYITTDDIVTYKGYYQDAENDEIYEQQWEYECKTAHYL